MRCTVMRPNAVGVLGAAGLPQEFFANISSEKGILEQF